MGAVSFSEAALAVAVRLGMGEVWRGYPFHRARAPASTGEAST